MDRPNLFKEDTDFNICLSWLYGSTDGATYSIGNHFAKKLKCPEGMSHAEWVVKMDGVFCWDEWENTIGYKHDYCIDDPEAKKEAERMVRELNAIIDHLNADPDYLNWGRADKDEGTVYGNAEAIADKAYALVCDEFDKLKWKYDSNTDNLIFFNDDKLKKTYVIEIALRECDEYEGD